MKTVKAHNILISGWYGYGNVGDEAILRSMLDSIKEEFHNCNITVLSYNTQHTKQLHKVESMPQFPIGLKSAIKSILSRKLFKSINAVKKCDVLIMGGGGFLSDWQPEVPFGWLKQMVVAKLFGKKTMLYAIGAGPFNTYKGKHIVKFIINRYVDLATVRDRQSKEWLLKCGVNESKVTLTADPAINLKMNYNSSLFDCCVNDKKINIGLVFTPYLSKTNQIKYNSLTNDLIKYLNWFYSNSDLNITMIPFQQSIDYDYNTFLIKEANIDVKVLDFDCGIDLVCKLIKKMDFIVSFRLHGNILAACLRIPFIPIIYHHKTFGFLERIKWEYFLEYGEGTIWKDKELDIEQLYNLTNFFITNSSSIISKSEENIDKYKSQEKMNIYLLKQLLKNKNNE